MALDERKRRKLCDIQNVNGWVSVRPLLYQLPELLLDIVVQRIHLLLDRLLALRRRLQYFGVSTSAETHRKGPYLELHLRQLEHEVVRRVADLRKRDVPLRDRTLGGVVERDEVAQHRARLVERAEAIVLAHAVLLQEVVLEHARNLERDLVVLAKRALADELHDLREVLLLLQDLLRLRAQLDEPGLCRLVVRLEHLRVFRVRERPVDGGEVLPLRELLVETPEHLDDTERGRSNGVREVTTRRRYAANTIRRGRGPTVRSSLTRRR